MCVGTFTCKEESMKVRGDVLLITTPSPTYYGVSDYSTYIKIRDMIRDKTTT
jgi:hypothetical protein